MNKKYLTGVVLATIFTLVVGAQAALASYVSPPYGEIPPAGQIDVEKEAELPADDYKFSPGEEITFKITVTNTGETELEQVKLTDYLPEYVELAEGETEIVFDLQPGESREFTIKVKVVDADQLPGESGVYCMINKAEAIAGDIKDEDTAEVCITKKVLGVQAQPEAGAEIILIGLGLLGTAGIGTVMKKRK